MHPGAVSPQENFARRKQQSRTIARVLWIQQFRGLLEKTLKILRERKLLWILAVGEQGKPMPSC